MTISPFLFEDSLRVLPRQRVSLIPQGVECRPSAAPPTARRAARAAFGFAPTDIVLLFVGGICARKDVGFLIDALPAVRQNHPSVRLLVVGPDLESGYADMLRHRAASLGEGMVRFTGYLEDPTRAYCAADLFVFASRWEGFGNVLIEAMAAGLPVVSRRLPGVTDSFIADGETGFLFSDAGGYGEIVDRLAGNPDLRAHIGRAAQKTAAKHDLNGIALCYAGVYRGEKEELRTVAIDRGAIDRGAIDRDAPALAVPPKE